MVLKDYLIKSKHTFHLYCLDTQGNRQFFSQGNMFETVTYFKHKPKPRNKILLRIQYVINIYKDAINLKRHLEKNKDKKFDILYAHNTQSCFAVSVLAKTGNIKLPVVLHIHDMMKGEYFRYLVKLFCRGIKTVAVSEASKKELISCAGLRGEDITVIHNGMDDDAFYPLNKKKAGSAFVIGYAGGVTPRKGVMVLAKAFRQVASANAGVKLVLAHNNKRDDYFQEVSAELEGLNVEFCSLERARMNEFYGAIDLFIAPSIKDCLPSTVLESMSAGTLVLGSRVDGFPEALPERCMFETGDSDALAELIKDTIDHFDEISKEIIPVNMATVKNKFSMGKKIKAMDDYLSGLV